MTDDHHRRRGLFGSLRTSFLTGLIVVLPIVLTIYLIWSVIGWIDAWVLPAVPTAWHPNEILRRFFGDDWSYNVRGLGVLIFLVFTTLVGWVAKGFFGRAILHWTEGLVERMPVVRSVYNGLKQIAQTVFSQSEQKFDRACLIEYPRKDVWTVGFVAGPAKGEVKARLPYPAEDEILTVFVATTPNPTSGYLVWVRASEVIMLDMTIEDAAKLIISAGLVYPNAKDPTVPPVAPPPHPSPTRGEGAA
jgi:uncharacterized membrane protein